MKRNWLPVEEIGIKGKKPWFDRKKALLLTSISLLLSGAFYFPIATGIFIGIKAFWLPALVAGGFYFFWSYPRQLLIIILAIILWTIIGPGIAGVWFWGLLKILQLTKGNWILTIILSILWTSGPIAIGKKVLKRFGIFSISRKVLARRIFTKISLKTNPK